MRFGSDIEIGVNFHACLRERGKVVPGSLREGHNVFTNTGNDWIAHLVVWDAIGAPDVPVTSRRLRYMGLGTGTQFEDASVTALATPKELATGVYLGDINGHAFPAPKEVRVFREFTHTEISINPSDVIPITEAGLFVDVFPVSLLGGTDDQAIGPSDTTLDVTAIFNSPVAYKTFEVINKTQDFILEIKWDLRIG